MLVPWSQIKSLIEKAQVPNFGVFSFVFMILGFGLGFYFLPSLFSSIGIDLTGRFRIPAMLALIALSGVFACLTVQVGYFIDKFLSRKGN